MTPLTEILVVSAAGLILLAILGVSRKAARSFRCPITGHRVSVDFRRAVVGGRLLDVERCSAFERENVVTCAKACLEAQSNTDRRAAS